MNRGMKITKGIISRDEALEISADYVAYAEGDHDRWRDVETVFRKMKRGAQGITYVPDDNGKGGVFVRIRVTALVNDYRAEDGPVVRVGNGEYTWRVDGDMLAFPVKQ